MKDMVYGVDNSADVYAIEILAMGKYYQYDYAILNLGGSHPTAYVRLPEGHKYDCEDYENIDIAVHGGLTYARSYVQEVDKRGWWIGWDYNHWGDYSGAFNSTQLDRKKWTTKEILEHVKDVVIQLRASK
jgi:hypothetical protein